MVNQYVWAVIITGVVIGFSIVSVAFIESPTIQTTEAESVDVYPKFKNQNPQTLSYTLIAQDAEIEISKTDDDEEDDEYPYPRYTR